MSLDISRSTGGFGCGFDFLFYLNVEENLSWKASDSIGRGQVTPTPGENQGFSCLPVPTQDGDK